jgi:hypothetical protein
MMIINEYLLLVLICNNHWVCECCEWYDNHGVRGAYSVGDRHSHGERVWWEDEIEYITGELLIYHRVVNIYFYRGERGGGERWIYLHRVCAEVVELKTGVLLFKKYIDEYKYELLHVYSINNI